ncbi:aminotransferase class III-fold pyridoxal phosphate-dependent enzyme [Prochlorococcus marinus]|uniref:aminotransferase class III-fold pyridoxal phosphate-dependent enzyme n=1 Tax=Prochlorococcus marinus TaxID=1219 RepID=UPI0039AF53A7
MKVSKGQELWNKASEIIPGGNMLLSKNKNIFSPDKWPCYYKKAKGNSVWDIDGNKYIDFSQNGVGSCSLGYAFEPIDAAVIEALKLGVMSTLNTTYEVELASKLIELHPELDMVKFARTGGEANSIAVRIARANKSKSKIAICGYHGWHDWYLSTNISKDDRLQEHLLKGLGAKGVPVELAGTTIPIRYNCFEDLNCLKEDNDIAALKMEVVRSQEPKEGFLEEIRDICDDKNIILIFDECTSGFRQSFGGIYKNYGIVPDMLILGKALGNGYAITSILGKRTIMESAIETFISSTFWTEAIGPAAALATLKEMEKQKSWEKLPMIGKSIKNIWLNLAEKYSIPIMVSGIDALASFQFKNEESSLYKTAFVELMLKNGILASTLFYPTTAHTLEDVNFYKEKLEIVFNILSECLNNSRNIKDVCPNEISRPSFSRLN